MKTKTPMTMEISTDLLSQIKARVILIVQTMENLPFLTKSDDRPVSRNDQRAQSEHEWPQPVPQFQAQQQQSRPEIPDIFKNVNPIAILLLGIVIGVIVVSMRPIVIQGK